MLARHECLSVGSLSWGKHQLTVPRVCVVLWQTVGGATPVNVVRHR